MSTVSDAIEHWHALLRPDVELTADFAARFTDDLRAERLFFGDRIHCPFLRPFFLDDDQVSLVRRVSESIARMGETVAQAALERRDILDAVALTDAERALVAIDPGYSTASTASRLDSFILPDSLQFAEYNAESPAGLGYTEKLTGCFEHLELLGRFRERFEASAFALMEPMLHALLASYREWGGTANPPTIAIVDWREVPTWAEFLILQAKFESLGVPTIVCTPPQLEFDGRTLRVDGRVIDLVYRRVLINDILEKPADCRALTDAYAARAVCVANTFRCKIPHKKAFFALLTDERFSALFTAGRARDCRAAHPVDAPGQGRDDDAKRSAAGSHPTYQEGTARSGAEAERRLRRPRRDAGMGGGRQRLGRDPDEGAERGRRCVGGAGEDSRPPRAVPALHAWARRSRRRHAGGLRAVSVSREAGGLPDATQRVGPGECDIGRRPGAVIRHPRTHVRGRRRDAF